MQNIEVSRGLYPGLFGGVGFHNNDAMLYPLIDEKFFWEKVCKSYREISPGFMRTFAGFANWTKKAMDEFAEYYEYMQKWTDTPMSLCVPSCPLHFSDDEMRSYCENVAEKLAYLYFEKDVKHIRYYCLCNELTHMHFGTFANDLPLFKKYNEMLYRAFQNRNLPVGLLTTDAAQYEGWKTLEWANQNMDEISNDYCVHIYERIHDPHDLEFYDFFYDKCQEVVELCLKNRKRVILGECGIQKLPEAMQDGNGSQENAQMSYLKGVILDTCRYYHIPEEAAYCGLMLTEMAFAAINAGIYAIAYWTYIDCPDPYNCRYSSKDGFAKVWGENSAFLTPSTVVKYNKWGAFKWEDDGNHEVRPHYWALAPLMKFFGRNMKVINTSCEDKLIRSCAVMQRFGGGTTLGVINRHKEATEIMLSTELFKKPIRVYEYDPNNVPYNRFADMQKPSAVLDPNNPVWTMKPESIAYFTTDYIEKTEQVEAEGLHIEDGILKWTAVEDPNHCYYRVFADNTDIDFPLDDAHQIASTAACYTEAGEYKYYHVLSVDVSGNI